MILSPKISFDVDLQQRYQLQTKANGEQVSGIYAMPSITLGATYSFDANTAVLASNQIGGSSSAPDSIFMISLWKKF
ncbi:MAG: nucleoid-structuring protein H-NS [Helicobacter sp.]|nr:nucleoid-structuring protein H-NS [Helicobacter sp.]